MTSIRLPPSTSTTRQRPTGRPHPMRFTLTRQRRLVQADQPGGPDRTRPTPLKEMDVVDEQYVLQAYRVSHWQAVMERTKQEQEQAASRRRWAVAERASPRVLARVTPTE